MTLRNSPALSTREAPGAGFEARCFPSFSFFPFLACLLEEAWDTYKGILCSADSVPREARQAGALRSLDRNLSAQFSQKEDLPCLVRSHFPSPPPPSC